MKRFHLKLLWFPILSLSLSLKADIIVKKDGSTLNVYNIELGQKYISYTKFESPDSEVGRVLRDECFAIKTEDGDMKVISDTDKNESSPSSSTKDVHHGLEPICIPPHPSPDNIELISKYNTSVPHLVKPNKVGKTVKAKLVNKILAFLDTSVLSDSIVTISFEKTSDYKEDYGDDSWWGEPRDKLGTYKIKVTNKSQKNVYVDVANSFRLNSKGDAESFYDNTSISNTSNSSAGAGVNLGAIAGAVGIGGALGTLASGVNIGKGGSSGTIVTETQDAILVIPPGGTITMPQRIAISPDGKKIARNYEKFFQTPCVQGKQYDKKYRGIISCLEKQGYTLLRDQYYSIDDMCELQGKPELAAKIKSGELKNFLISRIITYSTEPNFSKYTSLKFDLYTRGFIGISTSLGGYSHTIDPVGVDQFCIVAE